MRPPALPLLLLAVVLAVGCGKEENAGGEVTNGPNFNVRKESKDDVLFAIRNGGFSGQIMPANIVVGRDAELVASFLSKYSGKESGGEDVTESGQANP